MSSSRLRFFDSSVGTKVLIGVTGLFLVLYLIIHIAGNTVFLFGPRAFNAYAETLGGNPLIPVIEIVLLAGFLIHIYKTVRMFIKNQEALGAVVTNDARVNPAEHKKFVSDEIAKWSPIIKANGQYAD